MDTTVQQTLFVNGELRTFQTSLASILCDFGIDISQTRGVAVAINDEVVRKKEWPIHELAPGDRVEIVTARQGG